MIALSHGLSPRHLPQMTSKMNICYFDVESIVNDFTSVNIKIIPNMIDQFPRSIHNCLLLVELFVSI